MKADPNAPADARMMTIVHNALRRDLRRAQVALEGGPPPNDTQRIAIARHLQWMMGFLHAHHTAEDGGLYRMTREKDPGAAAILDAMHAEHEQVAPAIATLEEAAAGYEASDSQEARHRVAAAVERLARVLLPHLEREEAEAMPVVSAAITAGELAAWDKEENIDTKSFRELGYEGHWLIDDVSPEDRSTVTGLVPPVPRFILVHGFAGSYRRRKHACWGKPPRRVQRSGHSEVHTDAPIDAVWDVVRDVTRTGEWSHECVSVEWIDGATEAVPGARFIGRNRAGRNRWGRMCEIVSVEPYEIVWRTIPTAMFPDSTDWSIRLVADGSGTTIEQRFEVVKALPGLDLLFGMLVPNHRDRNAALEGDLRRLGAVAAEAASQSTALA